MGLNIAQLGSSRSIYFVLMTSKRNFDLSEQFASN